MCRRMLLPTTVLLLIAAMPLQSAEPVIRPLPAEPGFYLTDSIRLSPRDGSQLRELRLGDRSRVLGPGQSAHFSGGSVVLLSHMDRATSVELLDDTGRLVREIVLPASRRVFAVGESLVSFVPEVHQLGFPYVLDFVSRNGSTRLARPDRMIVGLTPLERHLVVDSTASRGGLPRVSEVIDETGRIVWTFTAPGNTFPRIVVRGDLAAAVHADRPDSLLRLLGQGVERPVERVLPGAVMTNAAFVTGDSRLFVWGPRDAALLDLPDAEIIWRIHFDGGERLLPSSTSSIRPVGDALPVLTRSEKERGRWQVGVAVLNLGSGEITTHRSLCVTSEMPTHVRRFHRGEAELLVLPDRVFEVSSGVRDGP